MYFSKKKKKKGKVIHAYKITKNKESRRYMDPLPLLNLISAVKNNKPGITSVYVSVITECSAVHREPMENTIHQ